jgi:hypothetical protein
MRRRVGMVVFGILVILIAASFAFGHARGPAVLAKDRVTSRSTLSPETKVLPSKSIVGGDSAIPSSLITPDEAITLAMAEDARTQAKTVQAILAVMVPMVSLRERREEPIHLPGR